MSNACFDGSPVFIGGSRGHGLRIGSTLCAGFPESGCPGVNLKRLPESGILAAVVFHMERASGIEPPSKAWEASILPMNYARVIADLIILPLFVAFCKFVCKR